MSSRLLNSLPLSLSSIHCVRLLSAISRDVHLLRIQARIDLPAKDLGRDEKRRGAETVIDTTGAFCRGIADVGAPKSERDL